METTTNMSHSPGSLEEVERQLHRMLHAIVFYDDPPEELRELPFVQFKCLHAIREHPGQKMAQIAQTVNMRKSALSQVIDRLVRRGVVQRLGDPDDRRVIRLELTPSINALLNNIELRRHNQLARILDELVPADRRMVGEALKLMADTATKIGVANHTFDT